MSRETSTSSDSGSSSSTSGGGSIDEALSQFFIETCAVQRGLGMNKFAHFYVRAFKDMVTVGSAAELYVEPMQSCISSVDGIRFETRNIAISSPGQIEDVCRFLEDADFEDTVLVYTTVSVDETFSDCTGASSTSARVRLLHIGECTKYSPSTREAHGEKYRFSSVSTEGYLGISNALKYYRSMSHTAALFGLEDDGRRPDVQLADGRHLPLHGVLCVLCLSWPAQAADWPTRKRKYNWPQEEVVDRVVRSGCSVVNSVYWGRDVWSDEYAWNITFSLAETVLLNSWTLRQQTVYHVLRFMLKSEELEKIRDNHGRKAVTSYHLKTVMLWTCEQKELLWWNGVNVIQACAVVFEFLLKCWSRTFCGSYFMENCNLFECDIVPLQFDHVCQVLTSLTDLAYLNDSLISRYISRCTSDCSVNVKAKFDDVDTCAKMASAIGSVAEHWKESASADEIRRYLHTRCRITEIFLGFVNHVKVKDLPALINEINDIDAIAAHYFIGLLSIWLTTKLKSCSFFPPVEPYIEKLLAHVNNISESEYSCGKLNRFQDQSYTALFEKAAWLMQTSKPVRMSGYSTDCIRARLVLSYFQLTKVSKRSEDTQMRCLASAFMAFLCYLSGQYTMAIRHCQFVTVAHKDSRRKLDSYSIEGQLLLPGDRHIDNVLGLVTLYRHIIQSSLKRPPADLRYTADIVFNLNVFVRYIEFMSVVKNGSQHDRNSAKSIKRKCRTFADIALMHFVTNVDVQQHPQINRGRRIKWTKSPLFSVGGLQEVLMSCAVKRMKSFHAGLSRKFSSSFAIAVTDVTAMHAFQRGNYAKCLKLCEQNITKLESAGNNQRNGLDAFGWLSLLEPDSVQLYRLSFIVSHALTPLSDDGIASIVALTHCARGELEHEYVTVLQLPLLTYLAAQSRLKLGLTSAALLTQLRNLLNVCRRFPGSGCVSERMILHFVYRKTVSAVILCLPS